MDELTRAEQDLYSMSDAELEAAFREARSNVNVVESGEEIDVDNTQDDTYDNNDEDVDFMEKPEEESDELDQGDEEPTDNTDDEPEETDESTDDNSETDNVVDDAKPATYKYKANGQEFEFTEDEIKSQFGKIFAQAMDYTKKTQELKPWRTVISALKDNNMSHDDVNLMIDVLKGDKDALASVIKKAGVDPLELDIDSNNYAPKGYGRSDIELDIEDVITSIRKDPEYKITEHVIGNEWDVASRTKLAENPDWIKGLHVDVKNGVYDKVSPLAMKMKVMDGGKRSDIEYYLAAGEQYYASVDNTNAMETQKAAEAAVKSEKIANVVKNQTKQASIKAEATKRRAAAPTQKAAGKRDVVDYLDESDESYDDWYKKLQDKM